MAGALLDLPPCGLSRWQAAEVVAESWSRVVTWCEQHAPEAVRSLRAPAGPDALAAAEAATGCAWPEQLRRWYQLHDGCQEYPHSLLLGPWMPLPLAGVVQEHQALLQRQAHLLRSPYAETADVQNLQEATAQPAGTVPPGFLPSFIPIAVNLYDGVLYVDTRPGPWSGCISVLGDQDGRWWDSVEEMLSETAGVLEQAGQLNCYRPVSVSGYLEWQLMPGPGRQARDGSFPQEEEPSEEDVARWVEAARRRRAGDDDNDPTTDLRPDETGSAVDVIGAEQEEHEDEEPAPRWEPVPASREAVLAEVHRYPAPARVGEVPVSRLDALWSVSMGGPSGFLAGVLASWGVSEELLLQLDASSSYHLGIDDDGYGPADRGASIAVEALRGPLLDPGYGQSRLLELSPAEFVAGQVRWRQDCYREGQFTQGFDEWFEGR
ncbi:SMI1/KNR4 family protein [Kineococcus sp. DHX-1]|uniref:SMI1/KNR4 family protein n=1 Tax=Kineococcus sp. DHX-1 TaxID=3349638 RepID=UPI0036D24416